MFGAIMNLVIRLLSLQAGKAPKCGGDAGK